VSERPFEDFTDAYEAMIDWPRRLANEEGFYRRLFEQVAARRVLDAACGTGRHAALFHSWGLAVEGADLSPAMIERCRRQFGESQGLSWAVRGFDQPHPEAAGFDAAICTGNSLALAGSREVAAEAVRAMVHAVRPGGALAIQVLNLWRLADGPANWQKCVRAALPEGDCLIVKGVRRTGQSGYVDLIVARLASPAPISPTTPHMRSECVPFLGFEAGELERMLAEAGAVRVELFGSYQRQPYDRERSVDLIAVGQRRS
jgi:SAM-dependent methyltransferase